MSDLILEDFARIPRDYWNDLRGKAIAVTGATGFYGFLLISFFQYLNRYHAAHIDIVALVRNPTKARAIFGRELPRLVTADLASAHEIHVDQHLDIIVHTAGITSSATMISHPATLIRTACHGTGLLPDLAREKSARMLFVSSMEVYGAVSTDAARAEHQLGLVDVREPRSCYPISKRMCEAMCSAYFYEYGLDAIVARPALTFGPGSQPGDNRAALQFARRAAFGDSIVLYTDGDSAMDTVYSSDAVGAIAIIASRGVSGATYNVANEASHTTVAALAAIFGAASDCTGGAVIRRPRDRRVTGYAADSKLRMSTRALADLGWKPQVSLERACSLTVEYARQRHCR